MPNFSNELPKKQKHQGFDLRRTPPSSPFRACCTAENLLVCDTHYWKGRTVPCERITNEDGRTIDDSLCSACQAKQPYRTHVYISCIVSKTCEHVIFECTASAAKAFADHIQANGSLRGCIFDAHRPKCTPNSKVVITTNSANLVKNPIPQAPDVAAALAVIWRLPSAALSVAEPEFSDPNVLVSSAVLDRMRLPPDNDGDPPLMAEILSSNGNGRKKRGG